MTEGRRERALGGMLPPRTDLAYDDTLHMPRRMESDVAARIVRAPSGCLLVGARDRITLLDRKRLSVSQYAYLRCISDTAPNRIKTSCPRKPRGRACVSPHHLRRTASKTDKHTPAAPEALASLPHDPFSDLPRISSKPWQTFTFAFGSTPTAVSLVSECQHDASFFAALPPLLPSPPTGKGCTTISSQTSARSTRAVAP